MEQFKKCGWILSAGAAALLLAGCATGFEKPIFTGGNSGLESSCGEVWDGAGGFGWTLNPPRDTP